MKKIIEWHENLSKSTKTVVYILGAIILGSIGSGVWEKVLEPLLNIIFRSVIILIGNFSSHFIDDLYVSAAHGLYDRSSLLVLFSVAVICYLGFLIIPNLKFYESGKREFNVKALSTILLGLSIMLWYHYIKIQAIKNIAISTINSIEIVRPCIEEKEYHKLRSEFFQMRSKADYESLYDQLEKIDENFNDIKIGPKQTF